MAIHNNNRIITISDVNLSRLREQFATTWTFKVFVQSFNDGPIRNAVVKREEEFFDATKVILDCLEGANCEVNLDYDSLVDYLQSHESAVDFQSFKEDAQYEFDIWLEENENAFNTELEVDFREIQACLGKPELASIVMFYNLKNEDEVWKGMYNLSCRLVAKNADWDISVAVEWFVRSVINIAR